MIAKGRHGKYLPDETLELQHMGSFLWHHQVTSTTCFPRVAPSLSKSESLLPTVALGPLHFRRKTSSPPFTAIVWISPSVPLEPNPTEQLLPTILFLESFLEAQCHLWLQLYLHPSQMILCQTPKATFHMAVLSWLCLLQLGVCFLAMLQEETSHLDLFPQCSCLSRGKLHTSWKPLGRVLGEDRWVEPGSCCGAQTGLDWTPVLFT